MLVAKSRNSVVCSPFYAREPRVSFASQNCIGTVSRTERVCLGRWLQKYRSDSEVIPERLGIIPTDSERFSE